MEERHDEVGSVLCGEVVSVNDVRGGSEEIAVTQRDTLGTEQCVEKACSEHNWTASSVCAHRPVVPLVCKTKATSSGVGSLES